MFCERNYDRNNRVNDSVIQDMVNEANKLEEEKRKRTECLHAILGITAVVGAVVAVVVGIGLAVDATIPDEEAIAE